MSGALELIRGEIHGMLGRIQERELDAFAGALQGAARIFVTGKGRSGLMASAFCMRLMHLGMTAYLVGEMTTPGIRQGDLLVICSGSGGTASLVSLAQQAKALGAALYLVTAAEDSPIERLGAGILRIFASTPKAATSAPASIQPMASLFEQTLLLVLDGVVLTLMPMRGETGETMFARHANLE